MIPGSRFGKKIPNGYDRAVHLLPAKVISVDTKGKFMWWTFKSGEDTWRMWCTYGMSAQWSRTPTKHTAATISFEGSSIHFNDPRHFGTLKFVYDDEEHKKKLATLGPDVLEPGLSADLFAQKVLNKPARTIAEALMDQKTISGCGNYMKSECLFRGGISPWRPVTDISSEEYVKLHRHVCDVAAESYSSQGASIKTYRTVDNEKGTTQFNFQIYSRKTCTVGHSVLREETPDGRTSWWCLICQK
jgi:DNA-formamidopyrimidine glycosylase